MIPKKVGTIAHLLAAVASALRVVLQSYKISRTRAQHEVDLKNNITRISAMEENHKQNGLYTKAINEEADEV